ncbi:MAG: hypothetical protein JWO95_1911 [Verrucomicrobiales bacterium]|nr:hypothetical protein [Verrucomicrobiales bacterium]
MADEIIYPVNGKRVWWGAIFAGSIVTLLVSFMLGLLGIAIGAANIDFRNGINPSGIGQSALIWWLVITFVAYFCGGCVAGRLANVFRRGDAMLHGIVTWGVVTIAVVVLVGSAVGGALSGMTNILSGGMQSQGGKHMTAHVQMNEPAGGANVASPSSSSDTTQTNPQSAQSSDQNRQDIREAAGAAAQMTSEAATWTLVALAVGALAAMFGGATGLGRTRARTTTTTTARA